MTPDDEKTFRQHQVHVEDLRLGDLFSLGIHDIGRWNMHGQGPWIFLKVHSSHFSVDETVYMVDVVGSIGYDRIRVWESEMPRLLLPFKMTINLPL